MPSPFAIVPASSEIDLGKKNQKDVTVSVTNTTATPVRGRVKLVAIEKTGAEWLSIADKEEHDFAAGETVQYTVRIVVPAGTQAGKFTFRMDCFDTRNPDENFAEGPVVAFEVQEPPPPDGHRWWLWPLVIAGVLVIVAGVVALILLIGGGDVTVPETVGMQKNDAQVALDQAGLTSVDGGAELTEADPMPAAGTVIRSSPEPGTKVEKGSEVALFTQPEFTQVPNLSGQTLMGALSLLKRRNLFPGTVKSQVVSETAKRGRVISQSPDRDNFVEVSETVDMTIGSASVNIDPNIIKKLGSIISKTQGNMIKFDRTNLKRWVPPAEDDQ